MDASPFGSLSAELRNEIYDLASYTPDEIFIELHQLESCGYIWRLKPNTCHPRPLALTEVCTEMRRETLGAFYAVNNVSLIVPMLVDHPSSRHPKPQYFTDRIASWLQELKSVERRALRSLEIDIGFWHIEPNRHRVRERALAKQLLALSKGFDEASVDAKVWLCVELLHPNGPYKPLIISFSLSPPDTDRLRMMIMEGKLNEYIVRAQRGWGARNCLARLLLCKRRLLALLAALEKMMEG